MCVREALIGVGARIQLSVAGEPRFYKLNKAVARCGSAFQIAELPADGDCEALSRGFLLLEYRLAE